MICTTTSHFWLWSGAGSAPSAPDHIRCQCGQYTAHEWRTLEAENARLTAQLAERDAEIARLKLTTRSDREYAEQKQRAEEAEGEIARLVELGERMRLSAMYYAANGGDVLCIEFHAACEAWRAVLAARGGAS